MTNRINRLKKISLLKFPLLFVRDLKKWDNTMIMVLSNLRSFNKFSKQYKKKVSLGNSRQSSNKIWPVQTKFDPYKMSKIQNEESHNEDFLIQNNRSRYKFAIFNSLFKPVVPKINLNFPWHTGADPCISKNIFWGYWLK